MTALLQFAIREEKSYTNRPIFRYGESFDCYGDESAEHVIVTYGRIFSNACLALEEAKKSRNIRAYYQIKPYKTCRPSGCRGGCERRGKHLYFFRGSHFSRAALAEHVRVLLHDTRFIRQVCHVTAIDGQFVKQAYHDSRR